MTYLYTGACATIHATCRRRLRQSSKISDNNTSSVSESLAPKRCPMSRGDAGNTDLAQISRAESFPSSGFPAASRGCGGTTWLDFRDSGSLITTVRKPLESSLARTPAICPNKSASLPCARPQRLLICLCFAWFTCRSLYVCVGGGCCLCVARERGV